MSVAKLADAKAGVACSNHAGGTMFPQLIDALCDSYEESVRSWSVPGR